MVHNIIMIKCFNCSETKELIPCRVTDKKNPNTIALNIVKQDCVNYYCEPCIKTWKQNTYNKYKIMLDSCKRFDETLVNNRYWFKIGDKRLVFFPEELKSNQLKLIRELKIMKQKAMYVVGKGYNIPFYKSLTRKVGETVKYQTHKNKYGEERR